MEAGNAELEIKRTLDEEPTINGAVLRLSEIVRSPETSDADRLQIWKFFFSAGFHREALSSMVDRIALKNRIHWGLYVEILALKSIEPGSSVLEALFKGIRRQNATEDIWASAGWNNWDARFSQARETIAKSKQSDAERFRSELVERFHFLKNQRLHDQAGRILKRLVFLYPQEKEFQALKSSFDEEWARDVLGNRSFEIDGGIADRAAPISSPDISMLACFSEAAEPLTRSEPYLAYDLAVGFYLMEAFDRALEFAKLVQPGLGSEWLLAEIYLKLHRHVEALDHLGKLEMQYIDEPETAFAVAYLRAQALFGLGQPAPAIEILRNIVQVRPFYRSAQQYLNDWAGNTAG